jgi:hypothetical protein
MALLPDISTARKWLIEKMPRRHYGEKACWQMLKSAPGTR